jgi:hypothetical protein
LASVKIEAKCAARVASYPSCATVQVSLPMLPSPCCVRGRLAGGAS